MQQEQQNFNDGKLNLPAVAVRIGPFSSATTETTSPHHQ
jgi:hypothetical protein